MKAILISLLLVGCAHAPERFFTQEQDSWAKEHCTDGCAIVPVPLMRQIIERLQGHSL